MSVSPVLIWFLVGVAFFALELVIPAFVIFFFGIGCWFAALAAWLLKPSLTVQLLIFVIASLVSLLVLRRWMRGIFSGTSTEETDSVNMVAEDATGEVVEAIRPPASGKVRYGGSYWQATSEVPVEAGAVVRILEKRDLVVRVQPIVIDKDLNP